MLVYQVLIPHRHQSLKGLIEDGINVEYEQEGQSIDPSTCAVVASAAIAEEHPEILVAEELGIPVLSYAKMLGLVQQK